MAALNERGAELGIESFPTSPAGYQALLAWLRSFGPVQRVGVEGTGAYGAGLARHLVAEGVLVIEVDRPNRQSRRRNGKSDPLDALSAARAAHSGAASSEAKDRSGAVEGIRALRVARRSAQADRVRAINQLRGLVTTAPDQLRQDLRSLSRAQLVTTCASFRPGPELDVVAATKHALREIGRRVEHLQGELERLDSLLGPLVATTAPELVALHAVGTDTAGALLVAVGDRSERLASKASFARLCGAAPIPASSGKTVRHRLNRGGDRQANSALWRIVLIRMRTEERTRAYISRRSTEGLTKREIMRCLKTYVAREVYGALPGVAPATVAPFAIDQGSVAAS